eukprot:320381-Rhodomonas_salina.1
MRLAPSAAPAMRWLHCWYEWDWGARQHSWRARHQANWRREAACWDEVCGWRELVAGAFYRNGCNNMKS